MSAKLLLIAFPRTTTDIANYLGQVPRLQINGLKDERKLTTTDGILEIACQLADYTIGSAPFTAHKLTNGTGYYDPLTTVLFEDNEGNEIEGGCTISGFDTVTSRRVLMLVIEPGMNIVIHDRFKTHLREQAIVLSSAIPCMRDAIGMNTAWSGNNHHDLAMMAKFFGFEYSRSDNYVYLPSERTENSMKLGIRIAKSLPSVRARADE